MRFLVEGAGSTFVHPILLKWSDDCHKAHREVAINYEAFGSGCEIRQLLIETVDFEATMDP